MMNIFNIDMLPAREGDCLWIEYGPFDSPKRILIDGGRQIAYKTLKKRFQALPIDQKEIELGVLTHVDADHVEGILKMMEDSNRGVVFNDFWFNGFHHLDRENFVSHATDEDIEVFGAVQGERLTRALVSQKWNWNDSFDGWPVAIQDEAKPLPQIILPGGMKLTLLGPTWDDLFAFKKKWRKEVEDAGMMPGIPTESEVLDDKTESLGAALTSRDVKNMANYPFQKDTSKANGSSIAFLAEFDDKRVIFAGDVHADRLTNSIKRCPGYKNGKLEIDAFKVSHHGSRKTLSNEVLYNIKCKNYLISTDGSRHEHPDEEAIARIIVHGGEGIKNLYFNYKTQFNSVWDNGLFRREFKYNTHFPQSGEDGIMRFMM